MKIKKEILAPELPVVGAVLIVYTATIFFQDRANWNLHSISGFSFLIALHAALYLYRKALFKNRLGIYFFAQGLLIFILSLVIKELYQAAYLGLIPLIISQCIHLLKDRIKIMSAVLYYYGIYMFTGILFDGLRNGFYSLSLLMLISSAILAYGYFYTRQLQAHENTQRLLYELESACDKLEAMTREAERQKLARDLHDTLSQGLAGVLMKLEASEVHLENGNLEKSKEIIKSTTRQVRCNLNEARAIIQDLRLCREDSKNLRTALDQEIEHFKNDTQILIAGNCSGELSVNTILYKNVLYIVREVLINIKKHAKASKVFINITLEADRIYMRIEDNGIGFSCSRSGKSNGHYGLIGLKERAKAINGEITIESHTKCGTSITLIVPV